VLHLFDPFIKHLVCIAGGAVLGFKRAITGVFVLVLFLMLLVLFWCLKIVFQFLLRIIRKILLGD